MNTLLQAALDYAAKGFLVFPLHTIKNNLCTCPHQGDCRSPGKHPRLGRGLNAGTTNAESLKKWWSIWPDANIGIVTGRESGILILDIDTGDGFNTPQEVIDYHNLETPDTLINQTGGGGLHYIYKYPEAGEFRSRIEVFKNVDSRANGAYFVAPPSLHKSGERYYFDSESELINRDDIKEAPKWFLDKIEITEGEPHSIAKDWKPSGKIPEFGVEALEACKEDASAYKTWINVGMAIHHTDPSSDGLAVWDWWSGLSDKYDSVGIRNEWANFSSRRHRSGSLVTFDTIFKYASDKGWENPNAIAGALIVKNIIESNQLEMAMEVTKATERIEIEKPRSLIPEKGLIKDIYDYIMASSIRPQPELAIASAIAFIGALAGQKYQTQTGLRTNVYIVGIAESGAGKDHARKIIKKLAADAGCMKFIGGEDFASGQAVISSIQKERSQLFLIDEFGRKLKAATNEKASSHLKEIITNLLVLYSSAGSIYTGKEYADNETKPRVEIKNPNACLYGTTVPSEFYESLSSAEGINGTLSRFILFEASPDRPQRQRPLLDQPTGMITEKIKQIAEYTKVKGNLAGLISVDVVDIDPLTVVMPEDVYSLWEDLDDLCTDLMKCPISSAVYSRVAENAAKLALIYSISIDHERPVIDKVALDWASEISLWTANMLVNRSNDRVADNQVEANVKKVLRFVKSFGKEGGTQSQLTRKAQTIRRHEREEIIAQLIEIKDIEYRVCKKGNKPVFKYFIC